MIMARKIPPGQLSFNFGDEQLILSQLSTNWFLRHWQLILMRDYERKQVITGLWQAEKHDIDYIYQTVQGTWIVRFAGRTQTNRRSWDVYFRGNAYCAA
jgi:hypothetical protein